MSEWLKFNDNPPEKNTSVEVRKKEGGKITTFHIGDGVVLAQFNGNIYPSLILRDWEWREIPLEDIEKEKDE